MFDPGAAIIWWAPGFDMPHRDTSKEGGEEVTTLQGHQLNNFLKTHEIKKLLVRRMVRVSQPPSPSPRSAISDGKLTKANQGIFKYEVFLSQVVMVEWMKHRTLEK